MDADTAQQTSALDDSRREQLLLENLPHVHYLARRIHCRLPPHVPLEDLVQSGVLGLMEAVLKYDPNKNVHLKHYAEYRIRGAILDSLRQADWGPRTLRRRARGLKQAISDCNVRLGRDPTESEIAAALHISLENLQQLLVDLRRLEIRSLQAEANSLGEDEAIRPGASTEDEDPFHQTLRKEMMVLLAKAIGDLPHRERDVLSLYHFKELKMKEVGRLLGIGASRVSQIHASALLQLRKRFSELLNQTMPAISG